MAWTKTDIANQALLRLGEKIVGDIDDEAEPAPTMKRLLDSVAREVQSAFPWQELVRRVSVDKNPTDDPTTGLNRFSLPGDTLRVMAVNPVCGWWVEFATEGDFIISGEASPAVVEYLRYEDEPGSWSQHLARAVYTQLAATAALAITQNSGISERMTADARQALDEGRRMQSVDNKAHSYLPRDFGWRRSRHRGVWS
jgi:hypothetical protein